MARYIILFDRNSLVGVARKTRRTGWELTTDAARGHPMISRKSPMTADYFRKSAALYYSWDHGTGPGNYSHLRILNGQARGGSLHRLGSVNETVGFDIINQDDFDTNILTPPTDLQAAFDYFGLSDLDSWGDAEGQLDVIFRVGNGSVWGEDTEVKIEGDSAAWLQRSNYAGVSGVLRELFNEPYWSNWQAYVMGGVALGDNDETEQDIEGGIINRSGIPGIFGPDMVNKPYLDHNTHINLMLADNISTTSTYGYYSAFFDQLKNNPNVKEVYIPNFYLVSSILSAGGNYSYPTLYNNYNQPAPRDAPSGVAVGKVKQLLSDAVAEAHPSEEDVLETSVPLTINNIQASPQTPGSLLSRFARTDFTATESLTTVENANKHIGLTAQMVKSQENAQTSIMSLMNVQDNIYPCSINIQFSSPTAGTTEPEIVQSLDSSGNDSRETFYNFVLYEVMKANILNYKNIDSGYSDPTQPTPGGMAPEDQLYEEIPFSAKIHFDGDLRYRGIDWTGNGAWANASPGNSAREGYSLRTIDFANMFRNIYQQQVSNFYGSGSNYNGFVGQTTSYNVVDGKGIIVGQRYKELSPPGGSWRQSTATDFHNAGFGAIDGYGNNADVDSVIEFYTDLAGFTNEKMRSVYDIFSHTYAFDEPLVFKLDKHEVLANGDVVAEPIQSIYIPKTGDVVEYKDTQVFAGKRYKYKIYSYNLVEGSSYSYTSPQVYPTIQTPYPSPLGRRLGFYSNSSPGGVNADRNWNDLGQQDLVRNVYVGKLLTFTTSAPTGDWHLNSGHAEGYYDIAAKYFVDVQSADVSTTMVGTEVEDPGPMESAQLTGGSAMTLIGNPDDENHFGLAMAAEDALNATSAGSPWRVRFFVDKNNSNQGRFVIAHRLALVLSAGDPNLYDHRRGLWEALSWSQEYEDLAGTADQFHLPDGFLWSNYLDLFGLGGPTNVNYTYESFEPGGGPRYNLMFGTGPHSPNPTIPWAEDEEQDRGTARVTVENRKSLKIIEIEVGETNPVAVADLPPQFPNVDIYPIKGVNNKIKILLNESNHTDSYAPVIINVSDEQIFEDVRIAQGREVGEGLLFGSDDSKLDFEIYRIETEPISYTDFSGHRKHNLNTITPRGVSIESASTFDVIEPNTVYYYCFRTVDKNGYISNPSPILKVQMIDDNGRIYPIIEPFALEPVESRKTEKSFKRYLEIDASLQEKNIDLGTPPDLSSAGSLIFPPSVTLGDVIWDSETTFKVRIISKDTGRKMDLNIDFDIEAIPNPKLQGN